MDEFWHSLFYVDVITYPCHNDSACVAKLSWWCRPHGTWRCWKMILFSLYFVYTLNNSLCIIFNGSTFQPFKCRSRIYTRHIFLLSMFADVQTPNGADYNVRHGSLQVSLAIMYPSHYLSFTSWQNDKRDLLALKVDRWWPCYASNMLTVTWKCRKCRIVYRPQCGIMVYSYISSSWRH